MKAFAGDVEDAAPCKTKEAFTENPRLELFFMALLSVILPAYNEEKMISKTAACLAALFREHKIAYELVFVDDGSKDTTWPEIEKAASSPRVVGIRLSRNFGKEAAIMAGLSSAHGDCCVVMDCDLQHPPQTIIEMYRLWEQGYEVVEGVKRSRGRESKAYGFCAKCFYKLISRGVKIDMMNASDFKLLDRAVVDTLVEMPERNAFFRALSAWVGYKTAQVEFDVQQRAEGASKWSAGKLFKYAVTNIAAFSAAPMQLVTLAGVLTFLFSVIMGVQTLVNYFLGRAVEGFTTVILLLLFIGSIIMISLGIIGFYLAKIYEEVKQRPRYIISKRANGQGPGDDL